MRILIFFLLPAVFLLTKPVYAQKDNNLVKADTASKSRQKKSNTIINDAGELVVKDSARLALEKMPRIAAIRSGVLPGLGQIYNKRWWKVPVIYGGFVMLGLAYDFNQRYYREFLAEVRYRSENQQQPKNPLYAGYSFEGIVRVKDNFRRNRDLSILGFVGLHAINIIDAYVDAKFFRFDVSNDLSLRIDPSIERTQYASQFNIIKINLSL
jgi:hypothetical protein